MTNDPNQVPPPPYGGQPPAPGQGPSYGQVPGYPGAQPGSYAGMRPYQPEYPQGTTILILGVLSLVVCQLLGPVAWYMGGKARKEMAASPTGYSNSSLVTIGWVMGIISTAIMIFAVGIVLLALIGAAASA